MRSRIVDTIPKQELSWKITFDIIIFENPAGHHNIFRFTSSGKEYKHGARTPAFWIINETLYLAFNTDATFNHVVSVTFTLNTKMSIVMEQVLLNGTIPTINVFVDQQLVHQHQHSWKIPFENVLVYMSDPWYPTADVKLSNFKYTQY